MPADNGEQGGRGGGGGRDLPRYPLTSSLVRQSMLSVFIRLAQLKARTGSRDPVLKIAVVVQSVTVFEQFMRLILEESLGEELGAAYRDVEVRGMDGRVRVGEPRLAALGRMFQNVETAARMLRGRGLDGIAGILKKHARELSCVFEMRHDLVHALGMPRFDEDELLGVVAAFVMDVLADRPRHLAAALLVEAAVMDAVGRPGAAREAAEKALEVCNKRLEGGGEDGSWALACRGHALARLGRDAEAEEVYGEAARAYPDDIGPFIGMGNLLVRMGRPEEALEWYGKAARIDPDHVSVRTGMGHALAVVRGADGTAAVECFQDAMRVDSEDVSLRAGCGMALALAGDHEGAAEQCRAAILLDPDDAVAHVALANALGALGRHDKALEEYEAGIRLSSVAVFVRPDVDGSRRGARGFFAREFGGAAVYRGMGNTLLNLGRPDRAVDALREAVEFDPDSIGVQLGLGSVLSKSGLHEEAVPAFRAAAGLDPRNLDAQLGLGEALVECSRHEEAVPAFRAAAGLDPGSFDAHLGLGRALSARGLHEEAVPAFRAAAGLDPGSFDAHLGLGSVLSKSGLHEEAVPAFRAAAVISPNSIEVHEELGFALNRAGRHAEGREYYIRAARMHEARGRWQNGR